MKKKRIFQERKEAKLKRKTYICGWLHIVWAKKEFQEGGILAIEADFDIDKEPIRAGGRAQTP